LIHRPKNKEELFNLRHSSARNVIERIFGVLKRCFRVLLLTPEYSLEIQARIPAALCAIHNFICIHDPIDEVMYTDDDDSNNGVVFNDDTIEAVAAEVDQPLARRDRIAQQMWDDYLAIRMERAIDNDNDNEDLEDSSNEN
jgi:hypothetical protein